MTVRPLRQNATDGKGDTDAIEDIFVELTTAFAERDAAKFDHRFTEDAVFTAVNGRRFTNWQDLHAYHKDRLANHADGIRTWYEIERIIFPGPDIAVVAIRQPLHTSNGVRANVGTWVLVKRNGQWWVCAVQNTGVAVE